MSASGSEAQKSDVHRRMEEAEMEMNYLQWELTRVVAERDLVWRGDLDQEAKRGALILCRMATSLAGGSGDFLADVAPSSEEEKVRFDSMGFSRAPH
jgi:hypothetical protein